MIRLEARFTKEAVTHLYETPLSEDQVIKEDGDDHLIVSATVRDTAQLEWWLLGYSERAKTQRPAALANRMSVTIERMARVYRGGFESGGVKK